MRVGAFGQGINAVNLIVCGLVGLGVAGCGSEASRFVGVAAATQGACGLGFDAQGKATATLMVRGGDVQFVPSDGVTVLPGHVDAAGHVAAGSNAPGADKKPFPQVFEGERTGDTVKGVFATPRCRAGVELKRD